MQQNISFSQLRQVLRNNIIRAKTYLQSPLWRTIWSNHISFYWVDTKNWGDALNPVLIEQISGIKAKGIDICISNQYTKDKQLIEKTVYLVIGSILELADYRTVVWGAGLKYKSSKLRQKPKKVIAVRGPLSAELIRRQGIECPNIYGDPALLFPRFYKPKKLVNYKLGIIPHFRDRYNPLLKKFQHDPDILIINIKGGINKVVEDICRCECIVSSSLHGLIAADAYGIPSGWIIISNLSDGVFKFQDYFASLGLPAQKPHLLTEDTTVNQLLEVCKLRKVSLDLDLLLEVCPFRQGICSTSGNPIS